MQQYPGNKEGSIKFHHDGYDYRRDNLLLIKVDQYRCSKKKCGGRAMHPKGHPEHVKVSRMHNHERNHSDFRVWKLRKALNEAAVTDLATPLFDLFTTICRA